MTKVAYIVVGWNNKDILDDCFGSIFKQDGVEKKVVYIDNNSKDDSVAFVSKKYPKVTIIEPGSNTGFAKGNNIGLAEVLKDEQVAYVALLNSDARLHEDWSKIIVDFATKKPLGAMYQGVTLDHYDHNIIDSTHIFISRNGQGTQGGWRDNYIYDNGPKKVFGVNAAACMISRRYIDTQPFGYEFFDEDMFMYLEDVDVSTRATMMGWDNYLVRGAEAYHMGSVSSGKNPGFSIYMTFRNNSALLFKNYPYSIILKILPKLIRGDFDTYRELRRRGDKGAARKLVKGRFVGVIRLPVYVGKRSIMRKHTKINYKYLYSLMKKGY